jgi:hypothetical protein
MTEEKRKFYVGVRPECGCHTAMLVDDEQTSPKEIARFARDMAKTKRVVRHVELTREEYMATFRPCPHKPPNAVLTGRGPGHSEET